MFPVSDTSISGFWKEIISKAKYDMIDYKSLFSCDLLQNVIDT